MADKNHYTAKQFIKAMPGTGGVITDIAKKVGCTWHTAKKYIDEYVTVAEAYEAEKNRITDLAKTNIINAIEKRKDIQVSKWFLSVKDPEFMPKERHDFTGEQKIIFEVIRDRDPLQD